jgi:hypothetical protein
VSDPVTKIPEVARRLFEVCADQEQEYEEGREGRRVVYQRLRAMALCVIPARRATRSWRGHGRMITTM